jgi:hypothetical protein
MGDGCYRWILAVVAALAVCGCRLSYGIYDEKGVAFNRLGDGWFYVEVDGDVYRRMGCSQIAQCPALVELMRNKIESERPCPGKYQLESPEPGYRNWMYAKGRCL